MPIVDVHAHAMPMPLLRWLEGEGLADLSTGGIVKLDPRISGVAAGVPLPLAPSMHDVFARITEMDAMGVDVHAVSLPPFLFASTCDDKELVVEVIRRGNDALLEYVAAAPGRLVALGAVPMGWAGVADEASRCLAAGMSGLAIGTRGAGRELDDDVNAPLWALAHERQAFVFLHPSGIPEAPRLKDFYLPQLLGYPMETAIAGARLAFGGVLERTPFPLCLAHGGGCLPWLRGRLDLGWARKEVSHTIPVPPSEYVRRLYVDTAVFDTDLLRHLVDDLGADRVLVGTDFPFDLSDTDPVSTVGALQLPVADRDLVTGRTAAQLLRLAD